MLFKRVEAVATAMELQRNDSTRKTSQGAISKWLLRCSRDRKQHVSVGRQNAPRCTRKDDSGVQRRVLTGQADCPTRRDRKQHVSVGGRYDSTTTAYGRQNAPRRTRKDDSGEAAAYVAKRGSPKLQHMRQNAAKFGVSKVLAPSPRWSGGLTDLRTESSLVRRTA